MIHRAHLFAPVLAMMALTACDNERQRSAEPDPSTTPSVIDSYQISTSAESTARAKQLPTVPSEDVSSLLGKISLPAQPTAKVEEHLPSPAIEWVVHATFDKPIDTKEVASRFGRDWRQKHGGLFIYGLDATTGHWTFLQSADGPERVRGLQFAWRYHNASSTEQKAASPEMYRNRLEAVQRSLNEFSPTKVNAEVDPEEAFKKAQYLRTLTDRFDRNVAVRLAAPAGKRVSGKELWDVMLCLGLRWGDMDCFHWQNPSGYGDDYFFSVWTSSPPGYFLPEEVAAGRVQVEDLVFGFSVPRSADPVTVYDRMVKAVEYAQKRLGGTLTDEEGRVINISATATEIRSIAEELTKVGLKPGSKDALRQF